MGLSNSECISAIALDTILHDVEFISFDVETTGLSPIVSRLVELSGVRFRLSNSVVSTFSSLINPECSIPPEVTAVHGITDEMVHAAPTIAEIVPQFLAWIGSDKPVLVAHNAPFDVGFLQVAMAKLRLPIPKNPVLDTLPLSRRILAEAPNHQLKTLVEYLALGDGDYHRALADSHHVKNILNYLTACDFGIKSWQALVELDCVFPFNRDSFSLDDIGLFDVPAELLEQLEAIEEAISSGSTITFIYKGMRTSRRRISPTAVIQNRGNFYLTGICHRMREERTFRLDRVCELMVLEDSLRPVV